MKLHELHPYPGSKTKSKRIGRGPGSGRGKTAGKGHKGMLARAGTANQNGFEGGQMPLIRRIPKRGFTNKFKVEYAVINLKTLSSFPEGEEITIKTLRQAGLVKRRKARVKVLGQGEVTGSLVIEAHNFSETARKKIEQFGGTARVIGSA